MKNRLKKGFEKKVKINIKAMERIEKTKKAKKLKKPKKTAGKEQC
jgi:hypothetical protein